MSLFRRTGGPSMGSAGVVDAALINSKTSIQSHLVNAIKELQVIYKDTNHSSTIGTDSDSTTLLNALEALFIHGLKDSLIGWSRKSKTSARGPEPNFWTYALIFSHKVTIERIDHLTQINSEVGRSRAWLRLALNDGLLGSYLKMMIADKVSCRRFYEKYALMRDPDSLDIIAKYVTGIEIYRFDLALNSGLLNRWPSAPLTIAGLLDSPESQAVTVAEEAAEAIDEDACDALVESSGDALKNVHPDQTICPTKYNLKRGLLNEDEALEIILKGGSGFGSPRLSNSSSNVESPIIGSYSASDAIPKGRQISITKEKTKDANIISSLSGSCPSSYQTLEFQAPINYPVLDDANVHSVKDAEPPQNIVNSGKNSVIQGANNVTKDEIAKILSPLNDFLQKPTLDNTGDTCQNAAQPPNDDSASSSSSEEEVSIYATTTSNKHYSQISSDTAPGSFSSPVIPLIAAPEAQIFSNSSESNKIKPCDTISASDGEDDFTNVVSKPTDVPSLSCSIITNASNEENRKLPCLSGFIDSWKPFGGNQRFFDTPPDNYFDSSPAFGFRFQKDVTVPGLNVMDSQSMLQKFDCIETEKGLDRQNYQCDECTRAIGTIFGPAKLCSYTKHYYCEECHTDEVSVIPARIVYNWDFKEYKVCRKSKVFLRALSVEPIIDASTFTKTLFNYAKELEDVLKLRKELKFINAYLSTCTSSNKPNPKKHFDKMIYPRMYLYEDVNKYSVQDLEDINNGKLKSNLLDASKFGRSHILGGCILCAGKGFICEVCKDIKPLYPFDLDSIVQCEKCFAVFHPDCSEKLKHCPKCDRIEARNLKWHVTMSVNDRSKSPAISINSSPVEVS